MSSSRAPASRRGRGDRGRGPWYTHAVQLLRFMLRSAGSMALLLVALGVIGALVNGGLVAVVHRALGAAAPERGHLALAFIGLGLGKVLSAWLSGVMVNSFSQESVTELRRALIARLLRVPFRHLERVGPARIHAVLTQDVTTVSGALQAMPALITSGAIILGGAGYLVALDPRATLALAALLPPGYFVYRLLSRRAVDELRKHRAELDRLHGHFEALTAGARELKMSAARRASFLREGVLETTESMLEHALAGRARFLAGQAANNTLVLVMVGLALFAAPATLGVSDVHVSGYVLTGLYLMGPVSNLLRTLPSFAGARIAMERIEALGLALEREGGEPEASADAPIPAPASIELRDATMRYERRDGAFTLGPLSLTIAPGEVLFITGGNGSGKSTLAKLLCGLYEPEEGALLCDGSPIDRATRDAYRQRWSAVFSEFHVFDRLYGVEPARLRALGAPLLARLGLADDVSIEAGTLSRVELSRGQRKRLALLAALLEDRPAYLFDEWAADQDPRFKETFYRELVPELRARGRTVVVVTHDDRYFDTADRIVKMDAGALREAPTR